MGIGVRIRELHKLTHRLASISLPNLIKKRRLVTHAMIKSPTPSTTTFKQSDAYVLNYLRTRNFSPLWLTFLYLCRYRFRRSKSTSILITEAFRTMFSSCAINIEYIQSPIDSSLTMQTSIRTLLSVAPSMAKFPCPDAQTRSSKLEGWISFNQVLYFSSTKTITRECEFRSILYTWIPSITLISVPYRSNKCL